MVKTLTVIPIAIDPEFKALFRGLDEEELAGLRDGIIAAKGNCDPICYWANAPDESNPILDGMHRYEICRGEGFEPKLHAVMLPDRTAAKAWILQKQLGRRNLSESERRLTRGRLYNLLKGDKESNLRHSSKSQSDTSSETRGKPPISGDTASAIASLDGGGRASVFRDAKVATDADVVISKAPELKDPIERGTIPLSTVPRLATATPATLNRLATKADNPKKLREAAKAAARKPSNNGQPVNRAKWKELEESLGKALRLVDDLNRAVPHANLHRLAITAIKQAMSLIVSWKGNQRA